MLRLAVNGRKWVYAAGSILALSLACYPLVARWVLGSSAQDTAQRSQTVAHEHHWPLDELATACLQTTSPCCASAAGCPVSTTAVIGKGQSFGSGIARVQVPDSRTLDWGRGTDFAVEAWVRTTDCETGQAFIGRRASAIGKHWMLGCQSHAATFELNDAAQAAKPLVIRARRPIDDGRWHHVAGIYDAFNGEARLYMDGQLEARAARRFALGFEMPGTAATIGWLDAPDSQQFTGDLDEVAVRGRALSRAEIDRHFNDGALGLALGYTACPTSISIMPIGDSITRRPGYRQTLWPALREEGYRVDFVGTESDPCSLTASCDHDPHSEGHPGWPPSKIAELLPEALRSQQPRVVLLHAGTNELDLSGIASILNVIHQYDPATVVVLARIINNQIYDPAITSFNAGLTRLAAARIASGERIRIVDHENALRYPQDMENQRHPNEVGFERMAEVWASDLRRFLPACDPVAPRFTSNPIRQASVGSPYEYEAVAAGVPRASYRLLWSPPGMTVHPTIGRVTWRSATQGRYLVRIEAANDWGSMTQSFELRVE